MDYDAKYENRIPYSKETRNEYLREESRLNEQFRRDLAEEHGLTGHPKEPKLWDLAWEHGHASGLNDVASYYDDFAELLDPVEGASA